MRSFVSLVCIVGALHLSQDRRIPTREEPDMYRQKLTNYLNTQYFGDFKIGDQVLQAIYDTGSFEILVLSTRCKTCKIAPYDRHESDSYKKNGTIVKHVFGSGPVLSMQAQETVKVGPMTARKQLFWEIIDHRIGVLNFAKFSAIVGIGPGHAPTNDEKTLVMSLGVKEFAICLERASGAPGWLYWGPAPKNSPYHLERSKMIEVPVIGELHWGVSMTRVGLSFTAGKRKGEKSNDVTCTGQPYGSCGAIVDSGTSLIAAPTAALRALSPLVGEIEEDCSNLHTLPVLHFFLGDHEFTLPPEAYVMKLDEDQAFTQMANSTGPSTFDLLYFKPKSPKQVCVPAFMTMDKISQHGPVWILGMPFLRYYFTTFDRNTRSLLFARASESCKPEPFALAKSFLDVSQEKRKPMTVSLSNLMLPPWAQGHDEAFHL